jgi:hypothetical protein
MGEINWIHVGLGFLSGGAFGAILKIVYDIFRSRTQPVGRHVEIEPVFAKTEEFEDLDAKVTLVHSGATNEFANLFIGSVKVQNRGNQNFADFELGIELGEEDRCVYVGWRNPDQHHKISLLTPVSPGKPARQLNFSLKPFNRRNEYTLKLYLVLPGGVTEPQPMRFSSPEPIRFVDMPTVAETLAQVAEGSVAKLGPFYVRIGR